MNKFIYYIIFKPYNVISQFSNSENHKTLALLYNFEKDVYPIGRLDADSEGLLILTNDNYLKTILLHPKNEHSRKYLVQVEGEISEDAIEKLKAGVTINLNKRLHKTKSCHINILNEEPAIPERNPPIRLRKNIPTSWLEITLKEGKNRQIRKMTASVGFPTLRLIRISINNLHIFGMLTGEVRKFNRKCIYDLLGIKYK
jgi:23S rRNA pseudouridine2457 synthase